MNGEPVGIAKDSRTPAEFDITRRSCVTTARTSSSPPSSAGPTRASSRTRTSGGTPGSARSIRLLYAVGCATSFAHERARRQPDRRSATGGDVRLLDRAWTRGARRDFRSKTRSGLRALWSAEEPALYTLELSREGRDRLDCRVGFRQIEIRDRAPARQRRAGADRRRQPPRARRRARPRGDARSSMEPDVRLMKQFNVNAVRTLALPQRPVLARPLRSLRAVRRRRGEHRVARVLRRALPRPALPGAVGRARGRTWSSATRTTRA